MLTAMDSAQDFSLLGHLVLLAGEGFPSLGGATVILID